MCHLSSEFYEDGQHIYEDQKCSTKVTVIESGFVNIEFPHLLLRLPPDDLLRLLGITVRAAYM